MVAFCYTLLRLRAYSERGPASADRQRTPPAVVDCQRGIGWDRFALDAAFDELPDKNQAADDDDWKAAV